MKNIGFSQRIDILQDRNEIRESLDVELIKIFSKLNYSCNMISSFNNKEALKLILTKCDFFVLTGGNDIGQYPVRDELEKEILIHAKIHKKPVLGICRGMQFMLDYEGFKIKEISGHVRTNHSIKFFNGIKKSIYVNSFHKYGIEVKNITYPFKLIASSSDNIAEQISHLNFPWVGIMWHPERNKNLHHYDKNLILELFS